MANTLTNLIPDAYTALDYVSRELVGFIPAVRRDPSVERAAVGQVVRWPVVPAQGAEDITPAVTPPSSGSQTIGSRTLTITKARAVPFLWNGEEQRGLNNGGPGVLTIQQDQIAQAIRTLTNEMEADLAGLHLYASRAFGTAGTNPFASSFDAMADIKKILDDNGVPADDRHVVMDTTAGAAMRKLSSLYKVNESGDRNMLRQGVLGDLHGFMLRESAQVKQAVTVGTGASATTNTTGYAIGSTSIGLASAGTGTIIAGDVITFAGDTNKYVVETGDADVSGGGTIVLRAPGLRKALAASAVAITVVAAATRNMFFRRNALVLATRAPALPDGGDAADDRATITDPVSGLSFEIAVYRMYRQVRYEIAAAWGVGAAKDEAIGVLLG